MDFGEYKLHGMHMIQVAVLGLCVDVPVAIDWLDDVGGLFRKIRSTPHSSPASGTPRPLGEVRDSDAFLDGGVPDPCKSRLPVGSVAKGLSCSGNFSTDRTQREDAANRVVIRIPMDST